MTPYELKPFTNRFGQLIDIGDTIIIVTAGRGSSVHTYKGIYLGCRITLDYFKRERITTVVEIEYNKHEWRVKGTGEKCDWQHPDKELVNVPSTRRASLTSNRLFPFA